MPIYSQLASIEAWNDEQHVIDNRDKYRAKFDAVLQQLEGVMPVSRPDAGFYLWAETPIDDAEFARQLFAQQHITVLPGSFLSRDCAGLNPGKNRIRMALVAELDACIEAAVRIKQFVNNLTTSYR